MIRRWLILILLAFAPAVVAQEGQPTPIDVPFLDGSGPPPGAGEVVRLSTRWSADGVEPGGSLLVAVVMEIEPGWHVQSHQPEWEFAIPTELRVLDAPPGVLIGDTRWPKEHMIEVDFFEEPLDFYIDTAVIVARVTVPEGLPVGPHTVALELQWQACDDKTCLPPEATRLALTLNVVSPGTPITKDVAFFAPYEAQASVAESIPIPFFGWDFQIDPNNHFLLWLIAAAGGLLLNFTPCVLPLVPIKIMSLSRAAQNRSRCLLLGLVMSLGVVAFWVGLGVAVAQVSDFATSKLFQLPWFTLGVGAVIALMAVGMLGAFAVGLPQWVYAINPKKESLVGSFGFGVMTAVLSTPCTAPLMGSAAAWAATKSSFIAISTFTAIGTGMALPYLVLSAWPKLVNQMPRTGPASELIKQVMGLLMLAAAAYFLGTGLAGMLVEPPDPPTSMYWWAVALFIAAAGGWMFVRTIKLARSALKRFVFCLLGVVMVALAVGLGARFTDEGPIRWIYYTPDRFAQARAEKKVILLEFTAQWCLNCHAMEQLVLRNERVVAALDRYGVEPIKVDLTGNNVVGNERLVAAGSRTIPYLVIYDRAGNAVFKSDAYTVDQVLDALERAAR